MQSLKDFSIVVDSIERHRMRPDNKPQSRQEYAGVCRAMFADLQKEFNLRRRYIRAANGHPRGVVVYKSYMGSSILGASYCSPREVYDRDIGLWAAVKNATRRIGSPIGWLDLIPPSARDMFLRTLQKIELLEEQAMYFRFLSDACEAEKEEERRDAECTKEFIAEKLKREP